MSTLVEQTKRADYHKKWDAIAKDEVDKATEEEELDKKAAALALGTDAGPASAAEAADLETNKKLRAGR